MDGWICSEVVDMFLSDGVGGISCVGVVDLFFPGAVVDAFC